MAGRLSPTFLYLQAISHARLIISPKHGPDVVCMSCSSLCSRRARVECLIYREMCGAGNLTCLQWGSKGQDLLYELEIFGGRDLSTASTLTFLPSTASSSWTCWIALRNAEVALSLTTTR